MGRVTRKEWYRRVNEAWPRPLPQLTEEEAIRAARRLYRFVKKQTFTGKVILTSGNRYTWLRYGDIYINTDKEYRGASWEQLVHHLSHAFAKHLPHSNEHARLELRMIKEVIRRGWLGGKLKREETEKSEAPAPTVDARIAKREARAKRLRTKIKSLTTRLKKLERSIKALQRRAAAPPKPRASAAPTPKPFLTPGELAAVKAAADCYEEQRQETPELPVAPNWHDFISALYDSGEANAEVIARITRKLYLASPPRSQRERPPLPDRTPRYNPIAGDGGGFDEAAEVEAFSELVNQ